MARAGALASVLVLVASLFTSQALFTFHRVAHAPVFAQTTVESTAISKVLPSHPHLQSDCAALDAVLSAGPLTAFVPHAGCGAKYGTTVLTSITDAPRQPQLLRALRARAPPRYSEIS